MAASNARAAKIAASKRALCNRASLCGFILNNPYYNVKIKMRPKACQPNKRQAGLHHRPQ